MRCHRQRSRPALPAHEVVLLTLAACTAVPAGGARVVRPTAPPRPEQSLVLLDAGRRSAAPVPEDVPVVRHSKLPGTGYKPGSPLHPRPSSTSPPATTSPPVTAAPLEAAPAAPGTTVAPTAAAPPLPPRAATAARAKGPKVSVTMWCIITLVGQFFLLYSVLFVLQTLNRLRMIDRKREERSWAPVVESVFFVPMLCVLFLAARLQAMQLTSNQPGVHGLPQPWVHLAMLVCTAAVLCAGVAQACIVFASKAQEEAEAAGRSRVRDDAKFARMCKNVSMALVYASFTTVCIGACIMKAPPELAGPGSPPRASPAVLCTVFLTVMYFGVYLGLVCVSLANELGWLGQRLRFCQTLEYLKSATTTVVFSPMLCALFLAAQAHAMQLDPGRGQPQGWAHAAFYVCSGCIVAHTLVAVAGTVADLRELRREGAMPARPGFRQRAVEALGLALMTWLYGGVIAIIVSIYSFGSAPSSLSLHCITWLTVLYFAVSWGNLSMPFVQRIAAKGPGLRVGEPSAGEIYIGVLAKEAVAFCPKFCVLFLGTVMRAQQLTNGMGAPQGWCQVAQCLAAGCIALLTVVRVDVLVAEPSRLTVVCTAMQYVLLSLLYVSGIAIVIALFLLTPENATGWGTIVERR